MWWARCAASPGRRRSGIWGRSIRSLPGCCRWCWGGPRGWRSSTCAATRSTRAWCGSGGPPIPTTGRARPPARRPRSRSTPGSWNGAGEVSRRVYADAATGFRQEGGGETGVRIGAGIHRGGVGAGEGPHVRSDAGEVSGAYARLRAHCSGGTYMRSVAHDLGQMLGCARIWTNCAARPAANSKSGRRAPSRNWNLWPRRTGWWTPSCRRRTCCRAFRRVGGRVDCRADPPWPQLSGLAIPFANGLAARQGGDAGGRTGGHRRGGLAEPVSSGSGAMTFGSLLR